MEISTPFVSIRGILSTIGLKKTNAYVINGVLMLITFFFCRILMWPYLYWWYSNEKNITFLQVSDPTKMCIRLRPAPPGRVISSNNKFYSLLYFAGDFVVTINMPNWNSDTVLTSALLVLFDDTWCCKGNKINTFICEKAKTDYFVIISDIFKEIHKEVDRVNYLKFDDNDGAWEKLMAVKFKFLWKTRTRNVFFKGFSHKRGCCRFF